MQHPKLDLEYTQLVSTLLAVQLQKDSGTGPLVGKEVQTRGICGTYTQGLDWLARSLLPSVPLISEASSNQNEDLIVDEEEDRRAILWLGSSIGNFSPQEALVFLRKELLPALTQQTRVLIGIDNCKIPEKVERAYADSEGVTRQFILNGISVVARILGIDASVLSPHQFDYVSRYNSSMSRNEVSSGKSHEDKTDAHALLQLLWFFRWSPFLCRLIFVRVKPSPSSPPPSRLPKDM